jgi:hypothetical protein
MAFPTNSAVRPIPGMAQNELHYMASIRYPIITQPLGMDRVVMLLNKAREAISRMSFHWVILQHPKNGECFLLVRPEDNSFRAPDGYQWKKLPDVSNKVFGNQVIRITASLIVEFGGCSLRVCWASVSFKIGISFDVAE